MTLLCRIAHRWQRVREPLGPVDPYQLCTRCGAFKALEEATDDDA